MLGTFALSAGYYEAYYGRAQKVRALIARDFQRVWEGGADVLFTPTSPTPAFPFGERTQDPVSMYLSDIYTVTANLAGIPGISVPIGSVGGLPVGGQFLAPRWEEGRMIRAASGLEALLGGEVPEVVWDPRREPRGGKSERGSGQSGGRAQPRGVCHRPGDPCSAPNEPKVVLCRLHPFRRRAEHQRLPGVPRLTRCTAYGKRGGG